METKHTKGPWFVINGWDKNGNGKYFPSVVIHGTIEEYEKSYGRNGITVNCSHDQEIESIMANAKIIAAAPKMHEELTEIVEYINKMGVVSIAMQVIKNRAKEALKATE